MNRVSSGRNRTGQRSRLTLRKAWLHFKTITHHRHLVLRGCFAVGLYRQGLLHDLSKYMPSEFLVGARYYQGDRSPNNAEREETGASLAWLHHKGRNRHHYEYWMDYNAHSVLNGPHPSDAAIVPVKMPGRYVVEMLMDRIAASKTYHPDTYRDSDPLGYYLRGNKNDVLIHPETAALLEKLLRMLAEKGETETFSYIRAHLHRKRRKKAAREGKT